MKITEHIKQFKGKTRFTFEILPPVKGHSIQSIYENIDPLMEFKPPFIDVTYHREEFVYKKLPSGLIERKTVRKRPGTVGICAALQSKYKIDAVPHIICGGFTKEETENALIDLNFLGIDNIMVLQGDARKLDRDFKPEIGGHTYASELLKQVVDLNRGVFLDKELEQEHHSDFCIGVSGYPEKHMAAPNLELDMKYLKQKVDKGADYIVTQMFFDTQKYIDFVTKCREMDINIPIVPGLKPITSLRQLTILPQIFHINLPSDLTNALEKAKNNDQAKEIGIEWAIKQSKDLISFGVPSLHYYSMGKSESVYKVASEVF